MNKKLARYAVLSLSLMSLMAFNASAEDGKNPVSGVSEESLVSDPSLSGAEREYLRDSVQAFGGFHGGPHGGPGFGPHPGPGFGPHPGPGFGPHPGPGFGPHPGPGFGPHPGPGFGPHPGPFFGGGPRHYDPFVIRGGFRPWRRWVNPFFRPVVYNFNWTTLRGVTCIAQDSYFNQYPVSFNEYVGYAYQAQLPEIQQTALDRCYNESPVGSTCVLNTCQGF